MCNTLVIFVLCSVFVLKLIHQVSSKYCVSHGINYTECTLMYWTGWKPCAGGHGIGTKQCPVGNEKRQKAVCCPRVTQNESTQETYNHCKINCNMTDDDFAEVRRLTTTVSASTFKSSTGTRQRSSTSTYKTSKGSRQPRSTSASITVRIRTTNVLIGGTLQSIHNVTKEDDSKDKGLPIEVIAGIAAAGAALAGLCGLFFCLFCKRWKNRKKVPTEQLSKGESKTTIKCAPSV